MNPIFDRVAIIGVGLLGASLGLALKAHGLAGQVHGVGRRRSTLETALERGAIDAIDDTPGLAAGAANLVVIATPAALVIPIMDEVRSSLRPGAVMTDVASTKAAICRHATATWPSPRAFVGSHPMAGSEKSGPEHAKANLYEGSVCLVENSPEVAPEARRRISLLWESVGARIVETDPHAHDQILAHTSHLPHVVASAVALLAAERGARPAFIGNGFRDLTRIANSRPEVWRDICLTNREAMLEGLEAMCNQLAGIARLIEANDAAGLDKFFEEGRKGRHKVLDP